MAVVEHERGRMDEARGLYVDALKRYQRGGNRRSQASALCNLGLLYMDPIDELFGDDARNQYGTEVYWRILLSPHIWVTPGLQTVIHPTLNPDADIVWIPHVKFRVAL